MRLVTFFIHCQLVCFVYSWGPIGHSIVVRLAQSRATEQTLKWLSPLTPWFWNGNLSEMASWADNIIYEDTNPTGFGNWQWTRPLHYINIPDWTCNFDEKRDCVDGICVSGAIQNYTNRLETILDEIQRQEALYFLIHYVGDIHQPLHTGFTNDRGGNSVRGKFMNQVKLTNLHSLWDVGLLDIRLHQNFSSNVSMFYDHIHELMLKIQPSDDHDKIDSWIKENIHYVCNGIYIDENNDTMNSSYNFTLGDVYYNRHIDTVEERLALGGYRLGELLNRLTNNQPKPPKDKFSASTIALIAVLSVDALVILVGAVVVALRCRRPKK